jgi:hypothetical protein
MKDLQLTDRERELIEAIRNFKNSKHNYSIEFESFVISLFETLMYEDD